MKRIVEFVKWALCLDTRDAAPMWVMVPTLVILLTIATGAWSILGAILYHSPLLIQVTPLIITPVVWVYFTMIAFKNRC